MSVAELNARRTDHFWLVCRSWSLAWFLFLLVVGLLGAERDSDVYYASLVMAASALFVALLGESEGENRGFTPPKLVCLLAIVSASLVYGSLLLSGVSDPDFRSIARGAPLILMSVVAATYVGALAIGLRVALLFRGELVRRQSKTFGRLVDGRLAWSAVAVGAVAFAVRFPNPSAVVEYWSGNSSPAENAGVLDLFSALCRPFLAVGSAMLLVRWATGSRSRSAAAAVGIALVSLGVFGTYGLNRAVLAAPLVAVLLLRSDHRLRARWTMFVLAGSSIVWLLLLWGEIRRSALAPPGLQSAMSGSDGPSFLDGVQVYGQAPQFPAVIVDNAESFSFLSLVADVLSPIPGVSDGLRSLSGTTIYNALLYGAGGSRDQILPTWAHVWAVGGVLSVAIVGLAVGCLAGFVVSAKDRSRNSFMRYGLALLSVWLLLSPFYSWLALSQAIFYFCVPVVLLGWASGLRIDGRSRRTGVAGSAV